MHISPGKVKAAVIQASPVYLNLSASLEKAAGLIKEAAGQGAQLVALGETWLSGYPAWLDYCPDAALWNNPSVKEVFAWMRQSSVVVPGKETHTLAELAKSLNITIVIGINERIEAGYGNGTLFNSLLTFNAVGEIVNHHRKLVPTYTERLVWGQGDGAGLKSVETSIGRIGGLVCWEHWMPLARQALHHSGEQIHVAVWPGLKEMHQVASRHYAFEGRCFVLAAGLLMPAKDLPGQLSIPDSLAQNPDQLIISGGSAIIAPDGRYLAGPIFDQEVILSAELDLAEIEMEKMTLDTAGHYYRSDIFDFSIHARRPS